MVDEVQINLRCKAKKIAPPPERRIKYLSSVDLQEAKLALSKQAQIESFQDDYKDLQANCFHCNQFSLMESSELGVGWKELRYHLKQSTRCFFLPNTLCQDC